MPGALGRVGARGAGRPVVFRAADVELRGLLAALGRVGAGLGGIAEIGAEVEFQRLFAALGRYGAGAVGGCRALTSWFCTAS